MNGRNMYQILQTRPFTLREASLARMMQPFELAGLVQQLDTTEKMLEFVITITKYHSNGCKNYEQYLTRTHDNMTPKEFFQLLTDNDVKVPTVFLAIIDDETGEYNYITKPETQALQSFIHAANMKGYIDADYLGTEEYK